MPSANQSSTAVGSGSREQLKGDRRGLGPRRGQRFGGQTEYLLRHVVLLDAGDDIAGLFGVRVARAVLQQLQVAAVVAAAH